MKKFKINAEMVASAALTVLGIWVITISVGYGIWAVNKPAKGFMPLISAGIMVVFSIIWFVQAYVSTQKETSTDDQKKEEKKQLVKNEAKWLLIVPILCLVTVFLVNWLGMYISLTIFLIVWLKFISHFKWAKTIITTAILVTSLYLIFTVGLNIPFPHLAVL